MSKEGERGIEEKLKQLEEKKKESDASVIKADSDMLDIMLKQLEEKKKESDDQEKQLAGTIEMSGGMLGIAPARIGYMLSRELQHQPMYGMTISLGSGHYNLKPGGSVEVDPEKRRFGSMAFDFMLYPRRDMEIEMHIKYKIWAFYKDGDRRSRPNNGFKLLLDDWQLLKEEYDYSSYTMNNPCYEERTINLGNITKGKHRLKLAPVQHGKFKAHTIIFSDVS